MYVVNSFNVCGKSVSVFSTSTVYTVNPRFAFIRGGRFILSFLNLFIIPAAVCGGTALWVDILRPNFAEKIKNNNVAHNTDSH